MGCCSNQCGMLCEYDAEVVAERISLKICELKEQEQVRKKEIEDNRVEWTKKLRNMWWVFRWLIEEYDDSFDLELSRIKQSIERLSLALQMVTSTGLIKVQLSPEEFKEIFND
jgi:hypothetical protein